MPEGHQRPVASARVPIRTLDEGHRAAIIAHLIALGERDRYLRFGYPASDEQIRRYAEGLDFGRDEVFGIFNRKLALIAMAHLAYATNPAHADSAEFGVSVSRHARGRGYGMQLFERAVVHARNEGVSQLFIHALSENMAMLNIARKGGATIVREGPESQAHLLLPPADFESQLTELVDEQVARTDYHVKAQARHLWRLVSGLWNRIRRWG
jgi:GNAT superfamily N-acetyltransferase